MPVSDCEVRDARTRRTRQLLHDALTARLHIRKFEDISVQEITETAAVNRVTFYDHYTDKFALLEALIAGQFHTMLNARKVQYDGTCPAAAKAVILAACDYLTTFRNNRSMSQPQSAFEPFLDAALTNAICRVLRQGMPEVKATIAGWAIYGAVKSWFRTADSPSSKKIAPVILQYVMPLLLKKV